MVTATANRAGAVDADPPEYSEEVPRLELSPSDIIIAVMGVTGSGKSTFIQYFSNREVVVGSTLESTTARVDIFRCSTPSIPEFYLIDTPGFDDTHKTDTQVLREITNWLSNAYTADLKLTGIIYLHRILDVKMGGSAMKNLRMFKRLCGDDSLGSVVLATTFWGMAKKDVEQSREAQLTTRSDFWGHFVQKGSAVFRQDQGKDSGTKIIDYLVNRRKPVVLEIQREMVEQNKTLDQTGAGVEVQGDLAKAKIEHEKELTAMKAEMQQANASRDIEWQQELAAAKKEIEEKLRQDEENRAQLRIDREELKREEDRAREEERREYFQAMLESQQSVMKLQHDLELMKRDNAHQLASQQLHWELKMAEGRARAAREKAESSSCVLM